MATRASTIEFLLEQMRDAGPVVAKKMFGEYAVFCHGKLIGLVCDDQLYIKPTQAGRTHIGAVTEAPPYPSAKPCFLIDGERWDDADWLSNLARVTATELPAPRPKRRKT